jgi:hypothetical protein
MALPGDINPSPAPGDPDQKSSAGQVEDARPDDASDQGDASRQSDKEAGSLPGLPKLFFAAEDLQEQQPSGQPDVGRQNGRSQLTGADQPAITEQSDQPGQPAVTGRPGTADEAGAAQRPGGADRPGNFAQPGNPGQPENSWQSGAAPPAGSDPQGSFGQPPGPGLGQQGRPGGPARRPLGRPARQQPGRQPDRELRQRALASLVLSVLALVALLGLGGDLHRGVYLLIFSAVVGIASCVIGITAVVKARKTGCYRPRGSIGGIMLGALAALLSIPILATYLAFPHQVNNYVKCLNQSQSNDTEQSCMDKFYKSIHLGAPGQDGRVMVQIKARSGQG